MIKNKLISLVLLAVVVVFLVTYGKHLWQSWQPSSNLAINTPSPSPSPEPSAKSSPSVKPTSGPIKTAVPTGTGPTFIDEKVPWDLLLADASCELKGEVKFLNGNTYDNQDARLIYNGVDHPGRLVYWTITPAEKNLEIGPNIFSKIPIPNGRSLLAIFPKGPLGFKKYELTAMMDYGRLLDAKGKFITVGGDVKIFKKPCQGKTTIVFP